MTFRPKVVAVRGAAQADQVKSLLARRFACLKAIEQLEDERKATDEQLMTVLDDWQSDYPGAAFDLDLGGEIGLVRMRVTTNPGRKTVSAEKLLELGVSPDVIQQATAQGPASRPFVRVERLTPQR